MSEPAASALDLMIAVSALTFADVFAWITGFAFSVGFAMLFISVIESINDSK